MMPDSGFLADTMEPGDVPGLRRGVRAPSRRSS